MKTYRNNAIVVGALFIIAAVTAIIGVILYGPILTDPSWITSGSGSDAGVVSGAIFEIIVAFSLIGISIGMYPILTQWNQTLAIGYVAFRLLESTIILIGVMCLLTVVTLSHEFAAAASPDAASYVLVGRALVALHDWTFLFGPQVSLGPSTLMMSFLLFRTKLVPRPIAILGLTGASLVLISSALIMFGVYGQSSPLGGLMALPVAAYEMSVAVWLIARGFNTAALATVAPKRDLAVQH